MRELWAHVVGKHRYWCPTHYTPEPRTMVFYVQRDTTTHRRCAYGAAHLVRFDTEDREIIDWPREWSPVAKLSLEATLREVLDRRSAA